MKGKEKCDLLNEIRQKIADENDIDFHIEKCTFEGDCTGTCPKCESELEYLENELEKKQNSGETIKLTNIFRLDDESPIESPEDEMDSLEKIREINKLKEIHKLEEIKRIMSLQGDLVPLQGDMPFEDK